MFTIWKGFLYVDRKGIWLIHSMVKTFWIVSRTMKQNNKTLYCFNWNANYHNKLGTLADVECFIFIIDINNKSLY